MRNGEKAAVDKLLSIVKGEENIDGAPQRDHAAVEVGGSADQGGVAGYSVALVCGVRERGDAWLASPRFRFELR